MKYHADLQIPLPSKFQEAFLLERVSTKRSTITSLRRPESLYHSITADDPVALRASILSILKLSELYETFKNGRKSTKN